MTINIEDCLKFQKDGNFLKAEKCYRGLLKSKNQKLEIYFNLAIICSKTNRLEESIKLFNKAIKTNPNFVNAYVNIAIIYISLNKFDKGINNLSKALEINKDSRIFFLLAKAYEDSEKIIKSIYNYKEAIKYNKNYAEAYCNLGNLLIITGNLNEAKKYLLKSITLNPKLDASLVNLGVIDMYSGSFKSAKKYFSKAIKISPLNSKAHLNYTNLINYNKEGDQHLEQILFNLKFAKTINDKISYHFALGKIYEDKKNYNKAFNNYSNGNLLRRKSFFYSIDQDKKLFFDIKKKFSNKNFSEISKFGIGDNSPIFIVGMPRSGTSLIEQILASHADIFGAGEINDFEESTNDFFIKKDKIKLLRSLDENTFNLVTLSAKKYLHLLNKRSNKSKFVTNKLPINFRWIGLIKILLPNAKIIHCYRHPADTCLSIYKSFFSIKGNEYSFDMPEIIQYYHLYCDLMQYWEKFNFKNFYNISYENLVQNTEEEVRKLLNFFNIEWDQNCLNFYNTQRSVQTSSQQQVRKGIYKTSVNKWKLYEMDLRDLIYKSNLENKLKKIIFE